MKTRLSLFLILTALWSPSFAVDFAKEIHPILKQNCLACHNATKAKADLILENREAMLKGGETGPAIVPGDAEASLLFTTASHTEDPNMPPKRNKSKARRLTPDELALLKKWINEGAKGGAVFTEAPKNWKPLVGKKQPIYSIVTSPDNRYAVFSKGSQIHVYDLLLEEVAASLVDSGLQGEVAHSDAVQSLAIKADLEIASGGYRVVKRWVSATAAPVTFSQTLPAGSDVMALSPDKKTVALGATDGTIRLYQVGAPAKYGVSVKDHGGKINGLAFTRDGKQLVSASADKTLRLRALADPAKSRKLDLPFPPNDVLVAGAAQVVLIAGTDNHIHRRNLADFDKAPPPEKVTPPLKGGHSKPVTRLAALPGQKEQFLSAGVDGLVIFWNLADGKQIRRINHGAPVFQLAVSGDGSLLATSSGKGNTSIWKTATGAKIKDIGKTDELLAEQTLAALRRDMEKRQQDVFTAKATASEKKVATEKESAAKAAEKLVTTRTAYEKSLLESEQAAALEKRATAALAIIDGKSPLRAAASKRSADATVALGKAKTAFEKARREWEVAARNATHSVHIVGLAVEEHTAALQQEKVAELEQAVFQKAYDAANAAIKKATQDFSVESMAFSADSKVLLLALKNGEIRQHRASGGEFLETDAHVGMKEMIPINDRVFLGVNSANQLQSFSCSRSWSMAGKIGDGESPDPLPDRVTALAWSPDGRFLATGCGVPSRSGELKLWNTTDGTLFAENKKAHRDTINSLEFSPSGDRLASAASDKLIRIWDPATLERAGNLEGHTGHVLSISWKSTGLTLASGSSDTSVKIWDVAASSEKQKIDTYEKEVTAVAYQPWTDTLVTGSGDKAVKYANAPLPGVTGFIHAVAISPNGIHVVAGDADGKFYHWNTRSKKLLKEIEE